MSTAGRRSSDHLVEASPRAERARALVKLGPGTAQCSKAKDESHVLTHVVMVLLEALEQWRRLRSREARREGN